MYFYLSCYIHSASKERFYDCQEVNIKGNFIWYMYRKYCVHFINLHDPFGLSKLISLQNASGLWS